MKYTMGNAMGFTIFGSIFTTNIDIIATYLMCCTPACTACV